MRLMSFFSILPVIALLTVLAGCGGSNTTGSLSVAVSPASVAAGKTITVTATYLNPNTANVGGTEISITTNRPDIFDPATVLSRQATPLIVKNPNAIVTDQTVTITARTGDLVATATVIVKANKLSVAASGDTASLPATAAGSIVRFVPSGDFITFTDGDGLPLANQHVTISVDTIVNQVAGADEVTFWSDYPADTIPAPDVITLTTDINGRIPPVYTVDMLAPGPGGTHVITVVFRATIGGFVTIQNAQYSVDVAAQ